MSNSILNLSSLLGNSTITAAQAAAQLADKSLRSPSTQKKAKKVIHEFAPPVIRPPRGPDMQIPAKEQTMIQFLRDQLADMRHSKQSAEARELFLSHILTAI